MLSDIYIERFRIFNLVLFSFGILASTFTELRLSLSVGYGEIVLLLSSIFTIILFFLKPFKLKTEQKIILNFWFLISFIMFFGFLYANKIVPEYSFEDSSHDTLAYFFVLICVILNFILLCENQIIIFTCIKSFLILTFLYFLILIIATLSEQTVIFNIEINYGLRLMGFSKNPNQLAGLTIMIPFLSIYIIGFCRSVFEKIFYVLCFFSSILIGLLTLSDGLLVSWVVSLSFLTIIFYFKISIKNQTNNFKKISLIILKLVSPIIFSSILFNVIPILSETSTAIYDDGGQGEDRFKRWEIGLETILKSPLFGFGPGSFSGAAVSFEKEEAHNSYIDWALNTGFIGLILLLGLLFYIFIILRKSTILQTSLVALCLCIMFSFYLRHPFFWFYLILLLMIQKNDVNLNPKQSNV